MAFLCVRRFLLPALLLAATAAAGCASSGAGDYNIDQGEVARFALASTSDPGHHPDSLAHLQIEAKDGRLAFSPDESYRQMLVEWTSARQGGAGAYFRTHATLWSRELSLASLVPERGVNTLSEDLAREMIAEREAEYDSLLQIDVYVFAPLGRYRLNWLRLDRPGNNVRLGVRFGEDSEGEERINIDPSRIETGPPQQAYHAGRSALYGRNAVFFDRRTPDGRDLLDAEELRLYVRTGYYFTWRFPGDGPPQRLPAAPLPALGRP